MKHSKWIIKKYKDFIFITCTKLICEIVFLLSIPFLVCADGSGTCGENVRWGLEDGTLTISGTGNMYSYSSNDDRWGGSASEIETVIIEEGVTSIGGSVFSNCSNLSSITIPKTVTSIGSSAFNNCSRLSNITIPEGVTSIEPYTFYNCRSLSTITIPSSITRIKMGAFSGCSSLLSVTIPEGVTSVEMNTFFNCSSLSTITIPNSITRIKTGAFFGCSSLLSVTIPEGVTSVETNTFFECSSLSSIVIPNSVISIEDYAFNTCSSLSSIIIPDSVENIGNSAFSRCSSLSNIIIPDSVENIGNSAFSMCSSLSNIIIPDSVENIGDYAFSMCSSLSSITIPDNLTSIGIKAIDNTTLCYAHKDSDAAKALSKNGHSFRDPNNRYNLKYLYENNEIAGLEISAVDKDLSNLVIPFGVTRIAGSAFYKCTDLKSVTIPESVTDIGYGAFADCASLASVEIPGSVTSIGEDAFFNCYGLKNVVLGNGITSIGPFAFWYCENLPNICIPESVRNIGQSAFYNCKKLKAFCITSETTTFGSSFISSYPMIYCYKYTDMDNWAKGVSYRNVTYLDSLDINTIQTVSLENDFRIEEGCSKSLVLNIFPNYNSPSVTWSSSDTDIIIIDQGIVTGVAPGTAIVTACVGNVLDSIAITVYRPAESFELNETEVWVVVGGTIKLAPMNVLPEGAETELTWSSSETSIATVDVNGLVATKKPGEVTITATHITGEKHDCFIHVCYPVTAISFETEEVTIAEGKKKQIRANVTMRNQNCVNHLVNFSVRDEGIATIDEDCNVLAHMAGTTVITATSASGISAECTIIVRNANILTLPASTTSIGQEAFAGLDSVDIVVIPSTVIDIAEDAFLGSDVVISAPTQSYAETWAREHGILME